MANRVFDQLSSDMATDRINAIKMLLLENPSLATFSQSEIANLFLLLKPNAAYLTEAQGLHITLNADIKTDNRPPEVQYLLILTLFDEQHRLSHLDVPNHWDINLGEWGDDERNGALRLYHDGDNSFNQQGDNYSFRNDSYRKKAKYSIVSSTITTYYPQLAPQSDNCINWETYKASPKNHNWVNLGTIPSSGKLAPDQFADMRQRLGMYRIARWLWLRDHPLRQHNERA